MLAQRGSLVVQTSLAPDARKILERLEGSINRLTWMVVSIGLLIAGVNLYGADSGHDLGLGLMVIALLAFGWGITRK